MNAVPVPVVPGQGTQYECGSCRQPITHFTGEPFCRRVDGFGNWTVTSVAYEMQPCGHVYIKEVDQ